jgi:glycosyltransferase involved in cell wall biosynthesis
MLSVVKSMPPPTIAIIAPMTPQSPYIGLNAHLLSAQMGYRRAGIHGYISQLLEHLPAADPTWRYRIFVGKDAPPQPARPQVKVQHSGLRTDRPLKRIVWEQLLQPLQLGDLDLVHELAFVAPVVMPKPFVVTVYDLTFIRYPKHLPPVRRAYLQLFTRLSCRRAKRVMAISQATASDLVTLLGVPPEQIDLAIPGVEARFRPLPAEEVAAWRIRQNLPDRFLFYLGTLEPRKNLSILLQAYAALPAQDRVLCPLMLAGGRGWMVEGIDRLINELGLSSTVHLPGFIQDMELPWWYNAAEAFIYPSLFEGWGLPVTEAMACGKPVLVSDVSSLPEAVGNVGMRLPPGDVLAWTEGLRKALNDSAWRAEHGERAKIQAAQFTWERTAQQTMESYRKALGVGHHA